MLGVGLLGAFLSQATGDEFRWGNDSTTRVTYASGGTAYLAGNRTNESQGCFVQLIHAGADQSINPAVYTGAGTSSDDVVVAKAWMGKDLFPSDSNGFLQLQVFTNGIINDWYFVRVWTAPSPAWSNGVVPMNPTNRVGESPLWQFVSQWPDDTFFLFGAPGGFSTTGRAAIVDTDGNGLPDWWEYTHFEVFTNTPAVGDPDDDLFPNEDELYAGTDPNDDTSLLEIQAIITERATNIVVSWPSVAGQQYTVEKGTNHPPGFSFSVLAVDVPATPVLNVYTDTTSVGGPFFYRITTRPRTNW